MAKSSLRENYEKSDLITWVMVHNIIPVVAGALALAGIFNLLQTKVELNAQKLDALEARVVDQNATINELRTQINSQSLDIKELQVSGGEVKGVSTRRQPTPTPTDKP